MAIAMIKVHGNPDPTPSGAIANKNTIPPIAAILKTILFDSIPTAINNWQVAIKPTMNNRCSLNHPLMKFL